MNLSDLVDPKELDRIIAEHPNPDEATDALLGRIMRRDPQKFADALARIQQTHPDRGNAIVQKMALPGVVLELMGYEPWLRKLGPHTFTGSFADCHHELWRWYWAIIGKLRRGEPLNLEDLVFIAAWSRDYGKSSHAEWIGIAEGCLVGAGYILYVARTQMQAEEHVISMRNRIEGEKVASIYPHMGKPKIGEHGNKYGWGKNFLLTIGGWAARPIGLDVAARGGKVLDMRPTLIILGDIDKISDSIAEIQKNSEIIRREILPMGSPKTRVLVEQNPIHSASWLNNILTRNTDTLAVRRVSGPVPAFYDIQIEFRQTEYGPRHVIVGGTPTWKDMNIESCQAFLDRSGYDAFMAEYQHDFSAEQEERVLPEYDDRVKRIHVITWSQFCAKYYPDRDNPPKRIPGHWPCSMGMDIGYTVEHLTAATWLTRAPENAPLTGAIFRYRGKTFSGVSINKIGQALEAALWPARQPFYAGERSQIQQQLCSHEKKGERLILNQELSFAFQPCDKDKWSGIPQWRHYLLPDKKQPHPFHPDRQLEDGTWDLGRPAWFDIVDDDQFESPRDDRGLRTHRDQAFKWRMKKIKVTESGVTQEIPLKINDDANDGTRMLIVGMGPPVIEKTREEKIVDQIPEAYRWENLRKRTDISPEQAEMSFRRARERAEKLVGGRYDMPVTDDFGQVVEEMPY